MSYRSLRLRVNFISTGNPSGPRKGNDMHDALRRFWGADSKP